MVSLKDIAAACGVSTSTVSKALNDLDDISAQRKEIIRQKAKELGYLPNMAARALKTNVTHNIGVLFVDDNNSGLTHPYFARVLEAIKLEAENNGYDITFINRNVGKQTMTYLEHCRYRNVDGVVIACVDFEQDEVVDLVESNIPVVTIDHIFNNCSTIVSDNVTGMRELTEYIIGKGHKKIAYIHGRPSNVTRDRLASFYRTMEAHNIEVPEEYVVESPYQDGNKCVEQAKKLMELKNPPTCIIFPDDYTAIAAVGALREAGYNVPDDISVAGYDGIPLVQHLTPKMTTYRQNMEEIGRAAAKQLIELIEKPKTAIEGITVIPGMVISGGSVKDVN